MYTVSYTHTYTHRVRQSTDYIGLHALLVVMGMIRPQQSIKDLRIRPLVGHTDTTKRICQ